MRRVSATAFAAVFAATLAAPASAHHSRSNFDLDSTIEIEGTVTEFSWRNPHSFVVVERAAADGGIEQWTFELNSTPVLKRWGWQSDTLRIGDRVIARGNPDLESARRFVYANLFIRGGEEIWAWGGPPSAQRAPVPVTAGSTDFSGIWRIRFRGDVLGRNTPDAVLVNTLPVTAKGQAQLNAFDPDRNPAWDCAPESLPTILGHPYPFEIVREGSERIVMRYEVNNVVRVVRLGMTEHPPDVAPSPRGHSIGRIENGELVIETAKFSPVRWGNGTGVDGGERKTTVERYRLSEEGKVLSLAFTMQDPEYLREPVTMEQTYDLTAGYALQDYTCDPATSRRHLTVGED